MNGWIKLHRKITEWEWYTDQNTLAVFIHLLIMANVDDKRYRGYDVKRGDCIIGRHKLATDLNISEQNVRTAINHLILTNEITIKTTNKFTIVTICNYDSYQVIENQNNQQINQQTNQQLTNNQPTTNQQLTTPKEYNKGIIEESKKRDNKDNADKSATRIKRPTIEECFEYCKEQGLSTYDFDGQRKSIAQTTAESFFDYYESNGWKVGKNPMKNWKAALNGWIRRDMEWSKKHQQPKKETLGEQLMREYEEEWKQQQNS